MELITLVRIFEENVTYKCHINKSLLSAYYRRHLRDRATGRALNDPDSWYSCSLWYLPSPYPWLWAGPSELLLTKRIWQKWWEITTMTEECNFSLASSLSFGGTLVSSRLLWWNQMPHCELPCGETQVVGKEPRKASSQQLTWNSILPTTSGVSLESSSAPSWALRWDFGPHQPMAWLQPMRDPELKDQLILAQIPDSQKLWNNKWCSKPLSLEVCFFLFFFFFAVIDN